jgi:hypothetical protein
VQEEKMINAVGCEDPRYIENLLGLLEYYEAIMERSGLVARAGEVRSLKLGFILDLLNAVTIPDGLKANLGSAVLGAWEMKCIDKTLERGEKELKAMRSSIAAVRNEVMRAGDHRSPMTVTKLDVAVMFALPLMQSDLRKDDVPGIHDLLARVMDGFAARMEG